MKIRPAVEADKQQMRAIALATGSAAHWSEEWYERIFIGPGRQAFVAESPSGLTGWVVVHAVADDWEIENIVVREQERRCGTGSALLQAAIAQAREGGARRIILEVRQSNGPALALYDRFHFVETGRRKDYYSAPPEDAILLTLFTTLH
jgi:[ribosomal protein S18]-alanine N-acetyltransferase